MTGYEGTVRFLRALPPDIPDPKLNADFSMSWRINDSNRINVYAFPDHMTYAYKYDGSPDIPKSYVSECITYGDSIPDIVIDLLKRIHERRK